MISTNRLVTTELARGDTAHMKSLYATRALARSLHLILGARYMPTGGLIRTGLQHGEKPHHALRWSGVYQPATVFQLLPLLPAAK